MWLYAKSNLSDGLMEAPRNDGKFEDLKALSNFCACFAWKWEKNISRPENRET